VSESIESIDDAKDQLGSFDKLIQDTISYLSNEMPDPKQRLKLERALYKYADSNTSDWILNFIKCIYDMAKRA
jgi:hypothetical protein